MTRVMGWCYATVQLVAALLIVASPARAQDAPPRFYEVVRALYAKAGSPNQDETIRAVNFQAAEQLAFEFPGQGWGMKSSSENSPPSKGCLARVEETAANRRIVKGVCYDWITGNNRILQPAIFNNIPGQFFIPVTASDHLGGGGSGPPPPGDTVTKAQLDEAILRARQELHTFLWNELAGELSNLRARLEKLEAGGGGSPPPAGDTSAILQEQLATTKAILELLKKTAGRFGVQ